MSIHRGRVLAEHMSLAAAMVILALSLFSQARSPVGIEPSSCTHSVSLLPVLAEGLAPSAQWNTPEEMHTATGLDETGMRSLSERVPLASESGPVAGKASKGGVRGSRAGKSFTPAGKKEIDAGNAAKNGGANKCENCGTEVVPGQKSQRGVSPPTNQRERDHIVPKSKGGDGTPSNGQVLCRECNLEKSDKTP